MRGFGNGKAWPNIQANPRNNTAIQLLDLFNKSRGSLCLFMHCNISNSNSQWIAI